MTSQRKELLGYIVDVAAIVALTVLGSLRVLPESAIMSGFTLVLVGRTLPRTGGGGPPGVAATSGLVMALAGLGALMGKRG